MFSLLTRGVFYGANLNVSHQLLEFACAWRLKDRGVTTDKGRAVAKSKKHNIIDIPARKKSRSVAAERLSLEIPADMRFLSPINNLLQELCVLTDPRAARECYIDDLEAAFRECCAHLITRLNNPTQQFGLNIGIFRNRIEIEIREPESASTALPMDEADSEDSSYALHLIQNRVDKVEYRTNGSRVTLSLVKYFVMPDCNL